MRFSEPDKVEKAKQLAAEGLSDSAIAREVGTTRANVWYWLKGRRKPRSALTDQQKLDRREYMRGYMRRQRLARRVERVMS